MGQILKIEDHLIEIKKRTQEGSFEIKFSNTMKKKWSFKEFIENPAILLSAPFWIFIGTIIIVTVIIILIFRKMKL